MSGILEDQQLKKKATKKCGLRFRVSGRRRRELGPPPEYTVLSERWELVLDPDLTRQTHNHEASKDASAHPSLRKPSFTDEATIDLLKTIQAAGVCPRSQAAVIQHANPDSLLNRRDVYNLSSQIRQRRLGPRTPIEE